MAKIAFVFPGQGAQSVGMAKELCASSAAARAVFDRARGILGYDLADVCFNGPEDRLNATDVCQPAIFVASWAALEQLRQEQSELVANCQAAAGLSLGEYTALAFAGSIRFEDTLRLVQLRGQAMQAASDATPSGMASILGMERNQVEELCRKSRTSGGVWIANLLCPGNIVVSGDRSAIETIRGLAESAGAMKLVPLAVAGAFHTELMRPADQQLGVALAKVEIQPPRIPVISNVDAAPHSDPEEIRRTLVRQVLNPVLWEDGMRRLLADGFDLFYEVGPGRVLKGLIRRIDRTAQCENFG
ncbi:MAG: ACP S-malonyltransferase [Planctomycetes bacterium]|nr:ACP S-malonyltransferase [Planctomycetota bacterium]